jgi:hypothetical protein
LAALTKPRFLKILSVVLLACLIEVTPAVMLVNPFIPDQYPFLAEAAWVVKNNHIADVHYLQETPGLGLMFSQFMLVTGLGPFEVSKIFPFFGVLIALLVILVDKELGIHGVVSAIFFLAFNFWYQTNFFHRQTYSFVLFLVSVLLILKLFSRRKIGYPIAYTLVFIAMVISHPGTPAFLAISLGVTAIGLYLFQKNNRLLVISLLSSAIFLLYNLYVNSADFQRMIGYVYVAMLEAIGTTMTGGLPPATELLAGYTESFQTILNARLLITILYLALASIIAFYFVILQKRKATLAVISLIHFGFALQLLIFLYGGPLANMRPLFFLVFTCALLVPQVLTLKPSFIFKFKRCKKIAKLLGLCTMASFIIMIPVLRYSGLPYLYTPSQELSAKLFLDTHYTYTEPIYATEANLPYGLSLLTIGELPRGEPTAILRPEESVQLNRSYLVLYRFITRDGYWKYEITYKEYVKTLLLSLQETHNLVYNDDQYYAVFLNTRMSEGNRR